MKTCFKCKKEKPLADFYKHKMMADGHLNKCTECTKKDASEHRSNNLEKARAYDRERAKQPHRQALKTEQTRFWRAEDTRRSKCHRAVALAIKKGELVRKDCNRCGEPKSLAHHEDYDKPLQVIWLCQPCHKRRHKEMKIILNKGF